MLNDEISDTVNCKKQASIHLVRLHFVHKQEGRILTFLTKKFILFSEQKAWTS